jgi:glycosyltransferase involved in cell wall biosynthesis
VSVSVVIPTHNRGDTLGRAIVSAAMQNPLEVLVIDDASTDDTLGIVEQLRGVYPCVRLHRHDAKADDWQEAAASLYAGLSGTHVICMGADDTLALGVVDSVCRYEDAAVVFHDYEVAAPRSDAAMSVVTQGVNSVARLSPEQMRHRLREHPNATETGIGSGIRRDCLLWLNALEWWRMGPWSDAVGYAAVGVLNGAVYVPGIGATFTEDTGGYGHQNRTGPRAAEYHRAVWEFLSVAGIPFSVAAAICTKRGVPYDG